MAEIELERPAEAKANTPKAAVQGMRIDPPHEFARASAEGQKAADESGPVGEDTSTYAEIEAEFGSDDVAHGHLHGDADADFVLGEIGEEISPALIEQFQHQAQQLATHLDRRQRELDRREAELNAALAKQEASARSARLWFQERHNDLEERKRALDERDEQITEQLLQLDQRTESVDAAAEEDFDRRQNLANSLTSKQNDLVVRDLDLVRRQAELDELTGQLFERQQELEAADKKLQGREAALKSAEGALALAQLELDDAQREFENQQAEATAKIEQQRQKYFDDRRREDMEHERQTQSLNARWGHLQRRSAALDQSRAETLRMQREALEMRLATEELWAQMSGMAPPATITQTLASLRGKLAEQQRMELADVALQRRQVEELAARIAKQHESLVVQRRQLETWLRDEKAKLEAQIVSINQRAEEGRPARTRSAQPKVELVPLGRKRAEQMASA